MTSWTLLLIYTYGIATVSMQSEDACTLAALALTRSSLAAAICIDEFEGKTLYFQNGKQLQEITR